MGDFGIWFEFWVFFFFIPVYWLPAKLVVRLPLRLTRLVNTIFLRQSKRYKPKAKEPLEIQNAEVVEEKEFNSSEVNP